MSVPGIASRTTVHPVIHLVEHFRGHYRSEVIRPTSDDRVEAVQDGPDIVALEPEPDVSKFLLFCGYRSLAWFDKQLVPRPRGLGGSVVFHVEAQEVKSFRQVDNPGLLGRQSKTSFGQPRRQDLVLHQEGIFLAFAEHHEIVCISYHRSSSLDFSLGVVLYSQGGFQAVEGHIQQQRANHTSLRGAVRGGVEGTIFQVSCLEPLSNEFLSWNVTEGLKKERMVDVVKSPLNVRIDDPLLPLVGPSEAVDLGDGIVASTPRSEAITAALELGLPVGFQGILDPCLKAAVHYSRDSERAEVAAVCVLRYVHPPHGLGSPGLAGNQTVHQLSPGGWRLDHQLVHARRVLASVDLRYTRGGIT